MGELAGWSYWKVISITGQSGAGADYQVELEIGDSAGGDFHLEGHCTNFPQDIRITDNDGTTLLDHHVEDLTADPIVVYVKVDDDLGSNQDIRVYYGKLGETTDDDGAATFPTLFEDFKSDLSKWTVTGTVSIVSEQARISGNDVYGSNGMTSIATISKPNIIEYGVYQSALYHAMNGFSVQPLDIDKGLFWNMHTSGTFYSRVDGTGTTDGTYTAGSIDDVKWELPSGNGFKLYRNDALRRNDTTWTNPNSANKITFMQYSSGQYLFVDYIRVRKYNSPEPAFSSAGAEQTPTGAAPMWYYDMLRRRNQ